MLPDWIRVQQEQLCNDVLARYAIPVEVRTLTEPDGSSSWEVRVFGGTLEAAQERMHAVQDRLFRKCGLSPHEALFMYVSHWVEWIALGGYGDPNHDEHMELLGQWATAYVALKPGYTN